MSNRTVLRGTAMPKLKPGTIIPTPEEGAVITAAAMSDPDAMPYTDAEWEAAKTTLGLSAPIRDEDHYEALLAFVEDCFDRFGGAEHHPSFALVDLLADRIREYEDRVHPWPDTSTPATLLASLMEEHGLRQGDLPEVGSQGVISEVLAGKRMLNLRQVKALVKRFKFPAEVWLP